MSTPGHDDYEDVKKIPHAVHKLWHGWHLVHQVIAGYGLIEALNKIRELIVDNKLFGHGG